ncbi:MAG TPA: glycosyl hydrolase, partial [Microlunatus sp.]|nr:glycosyl hydrolase [Microlunatus sp.]
MASALIISGGGAYRDPWHPFDQTSARLADAISSAGHCVRTSSEVEESLLALGSEELVVINVGNPQPA